MRSTLLLLVAPLVAFALYLVASRIAIRHRHAALAKKLGCKPIPDYPSPDPLGIVNLYKIFKANNRGQLPEHVVERIDIASAQEGRDVYTFQTHVFRNFLYFTCDPKVIQAILATQFKEFELGPVRLGTFSPLLGHGIFSADGPQWERSRSLLRPQFAREQVSDLDLEERHLQNLMKALPVKSDGWTDVIDVQPLNFRLTIDSASEFLFGESVNTQLSALPNQTSSAQSAEDANFVKAFEDSQDCITRACRFNDWYSIGLTKEYYNMCKICHQYIDRFVQKALNHEKKAASEEKERYVFSEALAEVTQDPVEIRDQLLSILVAGRDTTASLLSFLFLMLANHPHVFNKLRERIIEDFGTYDHPKKITFSALKACQYLQWCLNETLRLFPTVPYNSRRSVVDTTLPRGGGPDGQSPFFVPKGTEVNYSVYAMHRNKAIWGPDADKFTPERWNGYKPGFDYLPFNGGPRICLGQQFALTEAGYVTVRLLQRFDRIDGSAVAGLPVDWYLTLTGRPQNGVKLRLHEAAGTN